MDKYEMECAIASIQDALNRLEMLLFALIAELGYEVVLGPSVRIAKK